MCGIAGLIDPKLPADSIRQRLAAMCSALRHRGPDDEGIFARDGGGIGMRRLSIIDVEGGHQPFVTDDGSMSLVFNGEIYNYLELRDELIGLGRVFKTRSDGEVILQGYLQWGDEISRRLDGMFAFAIYDALERRIFAARDRFGEKPFYYTHLSAGGFAFGSEMKALLALPEVSRSPNTEAIYHYLTLQYIPDPLSGFEGISKLPPAHSISWKAGDSSPKIERYWRLEFSPKERIGEREAIARTRALLEHSTRARLMSEVPLGAFLSGGIDSSIIVALMARNAGSRVKTFSIGFGEREFSELPHARIVADQYGTEHHEFLVTPDAAEVFPRLVRTFDEPFADSSALPAWYLSELTRRHVTVALSGDGGDELFAGYQRYDLDRWANAWLRIPTALRRPVERAFEKINEPLNVPIERNWRAGLRRLAQVARTDPRASIIRWGSYFSEPMKQELCTPEFLERSNAAREVNSETLIAEYFDDARAESFLDRTLAADLATYLPGDLLVKTDRMTMAHSLEGRTPFLDHHLAEFAARLPENLKLRGREKKYILKKAFADLIPQELLTRPKQGFGIPLGLWMREGKLAEMYRDHSATLARRGMFRPEQLARLWDEHRAGRADHGKRLWTLLVLEEWYRLNGVN